MKPKRKTQGPYSYQWSFDAPQDKVDKARVVLLRRQRKFLEKRKQYAKDDIEMCNEHIKFIDQQLELSKDVDFKAATMKIKWTP